MNPMTVTTPVATKSYRCVHCVERIAPGTKHVKVSGKWEGLWSDWRAHEECDDAIHRTMKDNDYLEEELCPEKHIRGFSCREMTIVRDIERKDLAWIEYAGHD
ncbi:hypothetical protein [Methylobacter sp.]|uniref:hypothetical protein n=1 Tax=Methylobacter sp. TaxID=2051955 RepID=UPI00121FCC9F|nr:hypothetical protein [Methylobacter sp.]TAK59531.1 MAG: hypothetical protein EPO18_20430 [Methylobacter sp.]